MDIVLVYTGGGHGGMLPGVPARDLTDEETEAYGGARYLVGTGLYRLAHAPGDDVPSVDDVAPLPEVSRRTGRRGDK